MWITSVGNHDAGAVSQNAGVLVVLVDITLINQQMIFEMGNLNAVHQLYEWTVQFHNFFKTG